MNALVEAPPHHSHVSPAANLVTAVADAAATTAAVPPFLTFVLGDEIFAIGILAIKEIIEHGKLTEVPMMPACVRGVINLRGSVVPVMDLQARFGRPSGQVTKRTRIVILEVGADAERQVIGVIVDAVNEVLEIPAADIEPPPSFGLRMRSDFIRGIGKVHGCFVILLDVSAILSLDELNTLQALGSSS